MKIKLADIEKLTEKLFLYLKNRGVDVIEIPVDFYWHIPKEQIYAPYEQPAQLDVGQLSDDWNELQKVITGISAPITYNFVWLSAILRAIGENIP